MGQIPQEVTLQQQLDGTSADFSDEWAPAASSGYEEAQKQTIELQHYLHSDKVRSDVTSLMLQ